MDYQLTLSMIRAALDAANPQHAFARQVAERWLAGQPGHLTISVLLAEALLIGGQPPESLRVLRPVHEADPEHEAALALKVRLHETAGESDLAWAAAAALGQVAPNSRVVRRHLKRMAAKTPADIGGGPAAVGETRGLLNPADCLSLIPTLIELEGRWRQSEFEDVTRLAEHLLTHNPRLVKAHLILADSLMAQGDEVSAVSHLHQAAAFDPGGEVAQRIWGSDQPYRSAWPPAYVPEVAGPLPHPVAVALGFNLLPSPIEPAPEQTAPSPSNGRAASPASTVPADSPSQACKPDWASPVRETLTQIQTEINRLGGRLEPKPKTRDRKWIRLQPTYVLLSSKLRLEAKYGRDGWEQIDGALQALARVAEQRLQVPAGVLYVDDPASLAPFQLQPVDPGDPSAIKGAIKQLGERLGAEDQEVGWLLLIGGPDIIPFHRLPNPADDPDLEVPSDNPYGCLDDNYFVPQVAVGRLPDGSGDSPTLLLQGIATALAAHHALRRMEGGRLRRWWNALLWLLRGQRPGREASFGYAASVWRKASLTVFSQIGSARSLRTSPPLTAAEFGSLALGPARYGYFNLHGIPDGPNWYGQRDPTFPADFPAFPIALRPEDVGVMGCVPEVVFSEACYGGLVDDKTAETALSLRFLASGTQMFVGSSCIAYGGLNSTPEAADLLASFFWQEIMAGRSGGVALQQAKVAFAQYLDNRQGYLDGEDQKSLISFVLYGDPTITASPVPKGIRMIKPGRPTWKGLATSPRIVCAKGGDCTTLASATPELVEAVRSRVVGYLPSMESASLAVARQRICSGGSCSQGCSTCQAGNKAAPAGADRLVFTMHKSAELAGVRHAQTVKVTVDDSGQMLKLTVSK